MTKRFSPKVSHDPSRVQRKSYRQDDDLADKFKDHLEKSMTLDQLAEAQRLAREWKAKGK